MILFCSSQICSDGTENQGLTLSSENSVGFNVIVHNWRWMMFDTTEKLVQNLVFGQVHTTTQYETNHFIEPDVVSVNGLLLMHFETVEVRHICLNCIFILRSTKILEVLET